MRIYADGACIGNPGPGGFGWTLWETSTLKIDQFSSHRFAATTNNRMELMAVISALDALRGKEIAPGRLVEVFTDSNYVVQGMNSWLDGWKAKGWKTSGKQPVKNQDLWQRLDEATVRAQDEKGIRITFNWVKGHAGDPKNEEVDRMANAAANGGSAS